MEIVKTSKGWEYAGIVFVDEESALKVKKAEDEDIQTNFETEEIHEPILIYDSENPATFDNIEYEVTLSSKQAGIVIEALDLYSRIGMGQYSEIMDFKFNPMDTNSNTSKRLLTKSGVSDSCRRKLDDVACQRLGLESGSYFGIHSKDINEDFKTSFDVQQVLRNQLWKDRGSKSYSVDSNVMRVGSRRMAKIKTIRRKPENPKATE